MSIAVRSSTQLDLAKSFKFSANEEVNKENLCEKMQLYSVSDNCP